MNYFMTLFGPTHQKLTSCFPIFQKMLYNSLIIIFIIIIIYVGHILVSFKALFCVRVLFLFNISKAIVEQQHPSIVLYYRSLRLHKQVSVTTHYYRSESVGLFRIGDKMARNDLWNEKSKIFCISKILLNLH